MNKVQIAEVVDMFDLSADIAKSLVNRLEYALGKDGSPSTRLRMASSSVMALSEKCESESADEALVLAIGSFLAVFAEIAKDQTPAPSTKTTQAPKKARENWYKENSPEGQAIIAKTSKPRTKKTNAPSADGISPLIAMLEEYLNSTRR